MKQASTAILIWMGIMAVGTTIVLMTARAAGEKKEEVVAIPPPTVCTATTQPFTGKPPVYTCVTPMSLQEVIHQREAAVLEEAAVLQRIVEKQKARDADPALAEKYMNELIEDAKKGMETK